jgi:hypothetical protein
MAERNDSVAEVVVWVTVGQQERGRSADSRNRMKSPLAALIFGKSTP